MERYFPEKTSAALRESLNDPQSGSIYERMMVDLELGQLSLPSYLDKSRHRGILDEMRLEYNEDDLGLPGIKAGSALVVADTKDQSFVRSEDTFANDLIVPQQKSVAAKRHVEWKMFRVLVGHTGQVTACAFDPANEFFVTGSSDRTIKLWNLASGQLQLTLTGHIMAVRGLVVDDRHPYMFSCSEDKTVKCWDLETNKVIRDYHGHLSSVCTIDLHPTLDLIVTGGRDSSVKVWDIRTKVPVFTLTGHKNTVNKVKCRPTDPQIVSCSDDTTVRTWDLVAGKCDKVLTYHSKSVRTFCLGPNGGLDDEIVSGSSDGLKKFKLPGCTYQQSLETMEHDKLSQGNLILNTNECNGDGVMFVGSDSGKYGFYDWGSGTIFQSGQNTPVPGSLSSEEGIICSSFDRSGIRLVTGNVDKSVRVWRPVEAS